ncbi:hypothetical protein [Methylobacter sp. S3L5C]|uniref:hypothetical protein n=1 Tax=Methylobacter sp. S3L5C TaxID=2839024 RepID=UPI001FADE726|nr:hypothetical protein [Methylobacter sp. S3L5C]UOA10449.1 hypothetical protein KKZ03_09570 [Methylobacter sp. S3L5C]
MKIQIKKNLSMLLFALTSTSTLASLPIAEATWTGVKAVYSEQDFGLSILREAMLVALISQDGTAKPVNLNGRISSDGRLVWKTPKASLSACCESDEKTRS